MLEKQKICYFASRYHSVFRAAEDYSRILRAHCEVASLQDCERVILHFLPRDLKQIYSTYPMLANKYVVAICVWESNVLPAAFVKAISRVQEVWTCSSYCQAVFEQSHSKVVKVPHVVRRDMRYSEEDIQHVKRLISHRDDRVYYLNVSRLSDKRKNTPMLARVFQRLSHLMPDAILLVRDVDPLPPDRHAVHTDGNVIYIHGGWLTEGQVNALYDLAFAYVSPHHAEGWGFPLSDAMLFGKPVIATGYSGNLEFMNERNSFLLSYRELPILPEDQYFLFDGTMKWAYPDEGDLEDRLLQLYRQGSSAAAVSAKSSSDTLRQFSANAVAERVLQALKG